LALLEKLETQDVVIFKKQKSGSQSLKGKTFVLTGTLLKMARDEAKEKIRHLGGEISESVSQRTDYVVAGKTPGEKYEKARALGIKIIAEEEFLRLIS